MLEGAAVEPIDVVDAPQPVGDWWVAVLLAVLTLLGLALRLPSFGDSLFGDEVSTYYVVTGHSLSTILHLLDGHYVDINPPLYYVLSWLSEKLFGESTESLKLVSMVAGVLTIPSVYLLGRRAVSVGVGLVAATVVAFSPFLIFYSTEARAYSLMVLLVLLSSLSLLGAINTGRRRWWCGYALFTAGALYTHYTAVFVLAAQVVWALVTRPAARRAVIAATAVAVISYLPWLPSLIHANQSRGSMSVAILEPFSLNAVRLDLGRAAIGHPYQTLAQVPGELAVALAAVAAIAALIGGLIASARRRVVSRLPSEAVLVLVLALGAPVGIAIYSTFRTSLWDSRNLISSWPGFAVLLASVAFLSRGIWRWAITGTLVVALALAGISLLAQSHQRPDYQGAVAYIDHLDPHGGSIADWVGPTPGPLSETDVAVDLSGSAREHPIFRLSYAPLAEKLASASYARLPPQPGDVVARQTVAAAGTGTLFIIAPISIPFSSLESLRRLHIRSLANSLTIFASFLGALPARFRPLTSRTFAGTAPVTVYVYRSQPQLAANRVGSIVTSAAPVCRRDARFVGRTAPPGPPTAGTCGRRER